MQHHTQVLFLGFFVFWHHLAQTYLKFIFLLHQLSAVAGITGLSYHSSTLDWTETQPGPLMLSQPVEHSPLEAHTTKGRPLKKKKNFFSFIISLERQTETPSTGSHATVIPLALLVSKNHWHECITAYTGWSRNQTLIFHMAWALRQCMYTHIWVSSKTSNNQN